MTLRESFSLSWKQSCFKRQFEYETRLACLQSPHPSYYPLCFLHVERNRGQWGRLGVLACVCRILTRVLENGDCFPVLPVTLRLKCPWNMSIRCRWLEKSTKCEPRAKTDPRGPVRRTWKGQSEEAPHRSLKDSLQGGGRHQEGDVTGVQGSGAEMSGKMQVEEHPSDPVLWWALGP